MPETFSPAKLKAARLAAGLTQTEAAERAGMQQPVWARLELGGRPDPSISTIGRLAAALGITVSQLTEGE